MRAFVFIGAVSVGTWLFAVVGTALLGHAMDRRTAAHSQFVPVSTWDGPLTACAVQLVRALRRPALWLSGLVYGGRLLFGSDVVAELTEHDVGELVREASDRVRLETWRAVRDERASRPHDGNPSSSAKEDRR